MPTEPAGSGPEISRRRFLTGLTIGIGAVSTLLVGGVLSSAFVGPALRREPSQWIAAGRADSFPMGEVSTVRLNYEERSGFYRQPLVKLIMISRQNEFVVYKFELHAPGVHGPLERQSEPVFMRLSWRRVQP